MSAQSITSKYRRRKLARAELLVALALVAQEWQAAIGDQDDNTIPFSQWPPDDTFVALCRKYDLEPADLVRLLDDIGAGLERRAMQAGYEDHWD